MFITDTFWGEIKKMSKGQHGNIVGRKILFYISIIFPEIPIENEIETYILCQ